LAWLLEILPRNFDCCTFSFAESLDEIFKGLQQWKTEIIAPFELWSATGA
jgi:hypothetical protein